MRDALPVSMTNECNRIFISRDQQDRRHFRIRNEHANRKTNEKWITFSFAWFTNFECIHSLSLCTQTQTHNLIWFTFYFRFSKMLNNNALRDTHTHTHKPGAVAQSGTHKYTRNRYAARREESEHFPYIQQLIQREMCRQAGRQAAVRRNATAEKITPPGVCVCVPRQQLHFVWADNEPTKNWVDAKSYNLFYSSIPSPLSQCRSATAPSVHFTILLPFPYNFGAACVTTTNSVETGIGQLTRSDFVVIVRNYRWKNRFRPHQ